MSKSWIERIERLIERWLDQGVGRVWVVAVSAGGDSVGLLRALCQLAKPLQLNLSVAHLDHGVRGEAAQADAAFVAGLAASLGLPVDLGQWRPTRPGHFESDARAARYAWLTQVARARDASVVAVGHTRDDQAETILHRILRGTGPRGLAGIPARRTLAAGPKLTLVRPMLGVSRRGIRKFLTTIGQQFQEDETNAVLTRTRGRIRHDLLPKLAAEYNPNVGRALVRIGALTAALSRAIDREAQAAARSSIIAADENSLALKHLALRSTPRVLLTETLRTLWRGAGWPEASMSEQRWRRFTGLIRLDEIKPTVIGARVEVSSDGSLLVLRRQTSLEASRSSSTQTEPRIPLTLPGRTEVPWAACGIETSLEGAGRAAPEEVVDFDQVTGRLVVRAPVAGDRFDPLGMAGKTMPLADFFRGRRVPPQRRLQTPLVCDDLGIIWVAGHRIAERVKETDQTVRTLKLRLMPSAPDLNERRE